MRRKESRIAVVALPQLKFGSPLLLRRLGFRKLLDVISLDATLVRRSHGLAPADPADAPLLASNQLNLLDSRHLEPTAVRDLILLHVFD